MRKIHRLIIYFLLQLVILSGLSCGDKRNQASSGHREVTKEEMVRANQFLVGKDMELINVYIKRRGWDMEFSSSGLGYEIYDEGYGPRVERGRALTMEYSLSLLDGRVCYSSEKEGPKTFVAGRGGVEAGLEEGVLMLRQGDKARFILPPFLGHGLIGDQDRIPARAVLIYEVEITDVSGE